jgi:hypothetical protein
MFQHAWVQPKTRAEATFLRHWRSAGPAEDGRWGLPSGSPSGGRGTAPARSAGFQPAATPASCRPALARTWRLEPALRAQRAAAELPLPCILGISGAAMSDEIRDVTTITFSGPRFDDAGLELDVLAELLAYRKLLIGTAKELWRTENRERQRLPKGFEESIRLKFYAIESGSAVVPIKRVVTHDDSFLFEWPSRADEIDEAIDPRRRPPEDRAGG